jgi:dihydroorotase
VFSAHAGIELYATAFERAGALAALEAFASFHGADFYRLPRNRGTITLVRDPWPVPERYPYGAGELVPFGAGQPLEWRLRTADGGR